ncbi:MAG: hypothetical protein JW838_07210 [Spirochaetes bacterium]|nr:hypothetical protein [Spirochaetota bacterium]
MKKRKQYLIDRQYQLKTTFSIIGIVTIITALILGAITASVVYNNIRLNGNNTRIDNIYKIENSIFVFLSSIQKTKDPTLKKALRESAARHDENMETLSDIISYNNTIIIYNKFLLIAILIIIVTQCVVLYVMLIRKTHRVSGPIYVISNFMKEIIQGKRPHLRPLRENDELKEFYELFKEMVETVHRREKGAP